MQEAGLYHIMLLYSTRNVMKAKNAALALTALLLHALSSRIMVKSCIDRLWVMFFASNAARLVPCPVGVCR